MLHLKEKMNHYLYCIPNSSKNQNQIKQFRVKKQIINLFWTFAVRLRCIVFCAVSTECVREKVCHNVMMVITSALLFV